MQEQGHGLNGPVHVGPLDAVKYVCSYTCAFMRCTTVLSELQISSGPLLQERRGKRGGKSKDQTEEPQDINPDGRVGGFECISRCGDVLRESLVGDAGELLRYLRK